MKHGDDIISYMYIDSHDVHYSRDKINYNESISGIHPYENYSNTNWSVMYIKHDNNIIVSELDTSNPLYQYILVDTTTLG